MLMSRRDIYIPLIIFALFAGLYLIPALMADDDFFFRPVWDVGHYQSIAEGGYEVRPCDPARDYPMGKICGNAGWFPGWPMTVKVLSIGQVGWGLKILPYIFTLLGFILFYRLLLNFAGRTEAVIALIALSASPTAFYLLTGFPYAFMLFLFAAYLYYLYRPEAAGRKYLLPLAAGLLSLTYPSAFLTAIIPFIMLIGQYRRRAVRPGLKMIAGDMFYYLAPFALGPLLLSFYFYVAYDDFLLILHFQEKYDRNWGFPLAVIWESLKHFQLSTEAHFMNIEHSYFAANFIILWYGLIFFIFAPWRTKPELVVYVLLLYLFSPATGSVFSIWRHYLLLFPAVIMIALSPRPRWLKLAYAAIGLFLALYIYFPEFMRGYLV
ncbi:MAG: glycosyltransferase family 39 protein [FCB group bacterium]|nr:glycosyltransferase family 39 protein [FCB group bacterium]